MEKRVALLLLLGLVAGVEAATGTGCGDKAVAGMQTDAETVQAAPALVAFLQNSPTPQVSKYYYQKGTTSQERNGKMGVEQGMEPRSPLSTHTGASALATSARPTTLPAGRRVVATGHCDSNVLAYQIDKACRPGSPATAQCCKPIMLALAVQPKSGCLCLVLETELMLTQPSISAQQVIEMSYKCGAPKSINTCGVLGSSSPAPSMVHDDAPQPALDYAQHQAPPNLLQVRRPLHQKRRTGLWIAMPVLGVIASAIAIFYAYRRCRRGTSRTRDSEVLPLHAIPPPSPSPVSIEIQGFSYPAESSASSPPTPPRKVHEASATSPSPSAASPPAPTRRLRTTGPPPPPRRSTRPRTQPDRFVPSW